MSLESFTRTTHDDPLFAAEGLDTMSMMRTIDELVIAADALQEEFARRSIMHRMFFIRHPVATHALPTPFLRAVCAAEDARREFTRNTSTQSARALVSSWEAAQTSLQNCVKSYHHLHVVALQMYLAESRLIYEDDFQNTSTESDIRLTLELFSRNVEALKRQIQERRQLLENTASNTVPVPATAAEPGEISEYLTDQRLTQLLQYTERDFKQQWEIEERYFIRHRTPIFDGKPTIHEFAFYILKDKRTQRRRAKVSLADEYLFLPLGNGADYGSIGEAIYRPLIDRQIPYWYQDPALFYTTRDQQYWVEVASIADHARRPHLSPQILTQKSSLFNLILAAYVDMIYSYTKIMQARARQGDMSYSLLYGLLSRSNPSLLFMPFNSSIWRISQKPNFTGSGRSNKSMYLRLKEVLPTLSPEVLETVMQGPSIRRRAWREEDSITSLPNPASLA